MVAGGAGRAGLRLLLEALGHFRDPGARGGTAGPHTVAGLRLWEFPIASWPAGSRSACRSAIPRTGGSRRRRGVAHTPFAPPRERRTTERPTCVARGNRECRERVLSLLRRLLIGRCLWR